MQPPKWMTDLLQWGLPSGKAEDILGDLLELYEEWRGERSQGISNWRFFLHTLSLLPLFSPQFSLFSRILNQIAMFNHYLRIAWRQMQKHVRFSLINIVGLTAGLAAGLLILLYVQYELSYDKSYPEHEQVYRVNFQVPYDGGTEVIALTPNIVSPLMQRTFPEVQAGTRVYEGGRVIFRIEDELIEEPAYFYVDSLFLDIFQLQTLSGDPDAALREPRSLVLTESAAQRFFNSTDVVGKLVERINSKKPYKVGAVIQDPPANSHFQFSTLVSFYTLRKTLYTDEHWGMANYYTYLKLSPGANLEAISEEIKAKVVEQMGEQARDIALQFQPISDIHLYSGHIIYNPFQAGDITYVYLLTTVAFLILLIACINYVNLTTARSTQRAKEVGLRKVVGAQQGELFVQFIIEAVFITAISFLLALLVIQLVLPAFNALTERSLSLGMMQEGKMIWGATLVFMLVAFISGSYPALSLSRFRPIQVLRGSFHGASSGGWMRKGLVVFQFAVSIFLIIGTLIIVQQLNYLQSKSLGYDREHVLSLPVSGSIDDNIQAFRDALTQQPEVIAVSSCTESPYQIEGGYSIQKGWREGEEGLSVTAMAIDEAFVPTMKLRMVTGENFPQFRVAKYGEPNWQFILNEKAVESMGWTSEEAIGQQVMLNGRAGMVKGVVNNFHITSLHHEIGPLVLFNGPDLYTLMVRLAPGEVSQGIAAVEKTWDAWEKNEPFQYHFLDDQYHRLYQDEEKISQIFTIFSILAILIACLGLLGLISYTTAQRTKEIGIRKVLGASVGQLVLLLNRDFLIPVLVAILLSTPLAWYAMNQWLDNFSYKIGISTWIFFLAGAICLLISWITVSFQSFQAATADPVEALRDE